MTAEQKLFIIFSDLIALEFRCKACGSSVRRPFDTWMQSPAMCSNCQTIWVSDGSEREKFLRSVVHTLKKLAESDEEAKYELRAEIQTRRTQEDGK